MRATVHLILFACGVAIGVGAFLPILGDVDLRNIALVDLRDGFPAGETFGQLGGHAVSFFQSTIVLMLGAAMLIVLAGLVGSRSAAWLGIVVGVGTLGTIAWRMYDPFGDVVSDEYRDLLTNRWGAALVGGGLLLAVLACLVPHRRSR